MKFTTANLPQMEKNLVSDLLSQYTVYAMFNAGAATQMLVQMMGAALRDKELSPVGAAAIITSLFDEDLYKGAEEEAEHNEKAPETNKQGRVDLLDILLMLG